MAKKPTVPEIIEYSGRGEQEFFNLVLNIYKVSLNEEAIRLEKENKFYRAKVDQNDLLTKLGHFSMQIASDRKDARDETIERIFGELMESDLTATAKKKVEALYEKLKEEEKDDNTKGKVKPQG